MAGDLAEVRGAELPQLAGDGVLLHQRLGAGRRGGGERFDTRGGAWRRTGA